MGRGFVSSLPLVAPAAPETRRGAAGLSRALAAPWRFLPRRAFLGRASATPSRVSRRPPLGWGERAGHGRMRTERGRMCGDGWSFGLREDVLEARDSVQAAGECAGLR